MKDLELFKNPMLSSGKDGSPVITSLRIAEEFGKNHRDVLRAIRNYNRDVADPLRKIAQCYVFNDLANGKPEPYFELSEHEALIITGRFTGKGALAHQVAIADQFIAMRDYIRNLEYTRITTATAKLEAELKTVKTEVLKHSVRRRHEELMALVTLGIATVAEFQRSFFEYELTDLGKMMGYTQNKNGTIVSPLPKVGE